MIVGWVDDSQLLASSKQRVNSNDNSGGGGDTSWCSSPAFRGGAFTTGRARSGPRGPRTGPLPPFPSSKSAVKDLHNLQSNMARMKVGKMLFLAVQNIISTVFFSVLVLEFC